MDYYKIGQNIRKIRKIHGFSQEELAEKVDISTTHMSHIETGNTKLSLPVLVELANILNVKVDELLGREVDTSVEMLCGEIATVMERCTPEQARIIADTVKALKLSLDMNK